MEVGVYVIVVDGVGVFVGVSLEVLVSEGVIVYDEGADGEGLDEIEGVCVEVNQNSLKVDVDVRVSDNVGEGVPGKFY